MTKAYEEFRSLFLESHVVANAVASWWQHRAGTQAFINTWELTPGEEERWSHTDDGDITVLATLQSKSWSEDCKNTFTCLDDFPYREIIVEEAYKLRAVAKRCIGFAISNRERTHVAWVSMATYPYWVLREAGDSREPGVLRQYYFCPAEHIVFEELHGSV